MAYTIDTEGAATAHNASCATPVMFKGLFDTQTRFGVAAKGAFAARLDEFFMLEWIVASKVVHVLIDQSGHRIQSDLSAPFLFVPDVLVLHLCLYPVVRARRLRSQF